MPNASGREQEVLFTGARRSTFNVQLSIGFVRARARRQPCLRSPPSSLRISPWIQRRSRTRTRSGKPSCSSASTITWFGRLSVSAPRLKPLPPDEDDRAHERGEPLHRGPLPRQQGHPRGRVDDRQVPEERAVQHRGRRRLGLDRARGVLYGRRGAVLYRVRRRWLLRSARPARAAPPARSSRSRSASSQGRGGPP
jgi:hypothetical protein